MHQLMNSLVAATMFTLMLSSSALAQQQGQQNPQQQQQNQQQGPMPVVVKGKITEVKTERKSTSFVITNDEGKSQEIKLNGLINFQVRGPGDNGFIRPGVFVTGDGVLTNKSIFISDVSVGIIAKGRPPQGYIRPAPPRPGQSQNTYQVGGVIRALQPNPDYPDYTMLALNVQGRQPPINLEKDYKVTVVMTDPALVKPDMDVEVTGLVVRNNFNVKQIIVSHGEPFKSEDVLGPITDEDDQTSNK